MIVTGKRSLLFLILIVLLSCTTERRLFVDYSNSQITYSGRIDSSKSDGVKMYWSGSTIKLNFEGKSISALIEDDKGDNYYNIIVDNGEPLIFRPDTIKRLHQLASDLSEGKHTIEIFKRTEWDRGTTSFYGFQINGNARVLSREPIPRRKIEFYGNSITSGYAVEDFSGNDSPDSTFTNNYLSYAAIVARNFRADYHCICKSGIGITISWFPQIMPEIYDRINPTDENSHWDFSRYQPDIVVINLFQNDSWLVHLSEHGMFKMRFGDKAPDDAYIINAYQDFVARIRNHYPDAHIICTLGSMDAVKEGSKWRYYVEAAVASLNDKMIYTHFMPYLKASTHPTIKHHEEMANDLMVFIEENIDW